MSFGGIVVVAIAKPAKKVLRRVRECLLNKICVVCGKRQGEVKSTTTFTGPIRSGLCTCCYMEQREQKKGLTEIQRARFKSALVRKGRLVPYDVAKAIMEGSVFTEAAEEAKRGA